MQLASVLQTLSKLPLDKQEEVIQEALSATQSRRWVPNPGPQTDGYFTEADEVFFGGEAGGGKSDLLLGLASTEHQASLILRRLNKDSVKLTKRLEEIIGTRDGWNGQMQTWKLRDAGFKRQIDFSGCEMEVDKQKFKGDPHDLIGFDEITDFLESQYRFIIGWNRSVDPNQRCRVVCTGNPPTFAEGMWVIEYWGPWLNPRHPNPAKPGELRWFTTINGKDVEVDGRGPHNVPGEKKPIYARSRTFIRSTLDDNPDLSATSYDSVLAALPEEIRRAYRDGRFDAALQDQAFQCIPTAWVVAAQQRWKEDGYKNLSMSAMALDPAGGGKDHAVLGFRFGGWYAPLVTWQGRITEDGENTAGTVVKHRKNGAPVVIDVGGGYAGGTIMRFKENEIPFRSFNGAHRSTQKTKDGTLSFYNRRAASIWKFREELDPDQEGGSAICLPRDPELLSDLTSMTWTLKPQGILVESKEKIREKLGRSPGRGDVVTMCLAEGNKAAQIKANSSTRRPTVVRGHQATHSLLRNRR